MLWWLATVWWVGYAAVIGVVAATVVGATQMSVVFLVYHAVLRRARPGAGLYGACERLDRL